MKNYIKFSTIICIMLLLGSMSAYAGLTGSISYDFLPYQDLDEPIQMQDGSFVNDAQVQLTKFNVALEYPFIFSMGKTILMNELSYQNMGFNYRKTESILEELHRVSYTATVIHRMSPGWSLIAMVNPSLATDFEEGLSSDDLSFQTAVIANRHFSQKLSVGLGLAYSTQFGSAIPLPLLMLEWNDGNKWSVSSILPSNLEIWYKAGKRVDLGLLLSSDGDNYYFDPRGYQVERPELRYTMMTFGPAAKISLSKKLTLNIEAGVIGLHRFEFYSDDEEIVSNDLKPSQYFRLGLKTEF